MRIAVLSDIHGNLEALDMVFRDLNHRNIDDIWFLGDAINYGCDSQLVLKRLRKEVKLENWIAGNHEELYWGARELSFSKEAMTMMEYTRQFLESTEEGNFLIQNKDKMPRSSIKRIKDNIAIMTHHKPVFPFSLDIYRQSYLYPETDGVNEVLLSTKIPQSLIPPPKKSLFTFGKVNNKSTIFLCGHTHIPLFAYFDPRDNKVINKQVNGNRLHFQNDRISFPNILINPGSVGYPSDNCPYASYAIIDFSDNFVQFFRVQYELNIRNFERLINKTDNIDRKLTINKLLQDIKNARMPEDLLLHMPEKWYEFYINQRCDN